MLIQLVTIIFIKSMVAHASLGYTINVGSVLFSPADLQKDHWSKSEIGLLRARRYFQELLPPPNFIDTTNEAYIDKLIRYFRDTYTTIKKEAENEVSDNIMTTAFSDAIGGYLKMWVLPITKLGFYGGTVSQDSITKLYQFHDELNRYLDTDGAGWHSPDKSLLHTITVSIAPPRHITRSMKDACKQLAYYEKSRTGLDIPTPYINWEDKYSTMFIPLKNQSLIPLHSPDYPNVISKYYDTAKNCLDRDANNPYVSNQFDNRFQTWLARDVVPHLSDDHVYLALGNVLSLMNKSHDIHRWCEPKLHYLGQKVMIAGIPIDMSSKKIILILIILLLEVIWCIPALLYLACTRKKKKGFCSSLITKVKNKKSGYRRKDKYTGICRSYKISDVNSECFKTPQKLNSGTVSPELKMSIASSTSVNVIQEAPLKSSIKKKRTSHGSHLNTVSPKPPIASSAKVNVNHEGNKPMKKIRSSQTSQSQQRTPLPKPSTTSSASVNVIHEARLKSFVKKLPISHVQQSHHNTVSPKSSSNKSKPTCLYDNKVCTCSECSLVDESITNIESFYTETEIDKRHGPSSEPVTIAESVSSKLETASHTTYVKSLSNTSSEKVKIIDYVQKLSTGETAKECPCSSCVHDETDSLTTAHSQEKENPKTSLEAHMQMQLTPPMQPKQSMHSTQPSQPKQSTQLMQPMQSTQLIQPMQSTQLIQPMQSTQLIQPMQSTQLIQPMQSTQLMQPMQSTQLMQPMQSTQLMQSMQSTQLMQPMQPTQLIQPMQSTQLMQPMQSTQLMQPMQSTQLIQPMQSTQLMQPTQSMQLVQTTQSMQLVQPTQSSEVKENYYKNAELRLQSVQPYFEITVDKPRLAEISVGIEGIFDPSKNVAKRSKIPKRLPKTVPVQKTVDSTLKKAGAEPKLKSLIPRPVDDLVIKSSKTKGEPAREWARLSCVDDEADNLITVLSHETPSLEANSEESMVADMPPQLTRLTQTTQSVQPKQPTELTDVKNNCYKNDGLRLELGRPRLEIVIEKPRRRDISVDIDDETIFDRSKSVAKQSKIPKRLPTVQRLSIDDLVIKSSKTEGKAIDNKLNVTL